MHWNCTPLLLVALLSPSHSVSAQTLGNLKDSIQQGIGELTGVDRYVYVDDQGREVMVEKLSSVPERYRDSVRALRAEGDEQDSLFSFDVAGFGDADDGQTIYQYVGPDGRTVYTNIAEKVPPDLRDKSAMDLSHIPLNSALGSEIDRRLHEEHARLRNSAYCEELRAAASGGPWRALWDQYAPLVVCGFALLVFIFATPFFMRRVGVSAWRRTLTMAIPVLALAGLSTYGMTFANRRLHDVRAQLKPCTKEAWTPFTAPATAPATAPGVEPAQTGPANPLLEHARLVQQLQRQIDAAGALPQNHAQGIE